MKLERTLFVIVLLMCGVITGLAIVEPAANAAGKLHSSFAPMRQGGEGMARHTGLALIGGWLLGILQIAFFVGVAIFSVQHRGKRLGWLLAAGAVYALVFAMLIGSYVAYLRDPSGPFFGSFPRPTAWMLYGIWPAPLLILVLYVVNFRAWMFSPQDAQRFEEILRQNQSGK